MPRLKPEFDGLLVVLGSRIQGQSKSLRTAGGFKGAWDKEVPAEVSFALKDSLDDARRNFERKDAESTCPTALRRLSELDDDAIRTNLAQTLVAVQNMTLNLERSGARGRTIVTNPRPDVPQ